MKDKYITITGFKHYHGLKPFQIDNLLKCTKEPDNDYDDEFEQKFKHQMKSHLDDDWEES